MKPAAASLCRFPKTSESSRTNCQSAIVNQQSFLCLSPAL
jgi:hypothetical protein